MTYQVETKNGYNLFEMSSMLQKAIRRCDIQHAAYASAELSVKFRKYLWKRLLTVSAEDCFGIMTKEIVALKQADEYVNEGSKKGETNDLFIAKAIVLLCMARKNRDADYVACNFMWNDKCLTDEEFERFVDYEAVEKLKSQDRFDIPDYVYDVHTIKGKCNGKTTLDFFEKENEELSPKQLNFFDRGGYGSWYEHYDLTNGLSRNTVKQYPKFAEGKENDPTHNGVDLNLKEPNWYDGNKK